MGGQEKTTTIPSGEPRDDGIIFFMHVADSYDVRGPISAERSLRNIKKIVGVDWQKEY
jgi:hypothetical protein